MGTGLMVDILRSASHGDYDCTAGGATSIRRGVTQALLMGIPGGNYTEDDVIKHIARGIPVLDVVVREFGGVPYVTCKPREVEGHSMAGGNFVYSSDSRFRQVCQYPISVHDRVER